MATSKDDNVFSDAYDYDYPEPPIPPDPPDTVSLDASIQPSPQMTTLELDNGLPKKVRPQPDSKTLMMNADIRDLNILHVEDIPLKSNYETIDKIFRKFGIIKEIRMDIKSNYWEAWISFSSYEAALEASKTIRDIRIRECNIKGALCDKAPKNLDIYKPEEWRENSQNPTKYTARVPKPPSWFIARGKGENYNYFKMSKYIQKKIGAIKSKDISKFSHQCLLIHTNSVVQAKMLANIDLDDSEMLKEIKPHQNFSYGKGVVFDRDLYEFSEQEILDMCPLNIWKVDKVPRTNMIILTYEHPHVPDCVIIENERLKVREYKPKPMQCYRCFKFGHPSKYCKNNKVCINCSAQEHGHCLNDTKCVNCLNGHKANDKNCPEYKKEEEALLKSNAEHISVGYAKKLLGHQKNYAKAAKSHQSLNSDAINILQTGNSSAKQAIKTNGAIPKSNKNTYSGATISDNRDGDLAAYEDNSSPLPDLRKVTVHQEKENKSNKSSKNRKRERQPSSTPPMSPKTTTTNRFNVLDIDNSGCLNNEDDLEEYKNEKPKSKKVLVEVHHPPLQQDQHHKTKSKAKPNISRIPMSNKPDKKKEAIKNNH